MADLNTTATFKANISSLKKAMQEASRSIRLANAEFKAASASMDSWSSSADGLDAKLKQLDTVLESQNKQMELMKQELTQTEAAYGKNSAAADRVRIAIFNQQAAISKTEAEIKKYQKSLEELNKSENDAAQGTDKFDSATDKLSDTIQKQESKLEDLKKAYKDAKLSGNTEDAEMYAKAIKDLSARLNENKSKMREADKAADDLDASIETVEQDTKQASEGFTVMKGALSNLVASGIKSAVRGLKNLGRAAKEAYKEFDEGRDKVITATGATGKAAEELEQNYKNVAKSVNGDLSSLGDTLGSVSTRFGFTDDALEEATIQFQKFAKITETDAKTAVELVSRAMGDAGIEATEYSSVLDNLAVASQQSGISVDKLTETLTKYGAPMRALGFDTKESIALFSQWEKAGVNTEIAFSGMKKAIGTWGKANKDPRNEFKKTLKEIESAPTLAQATTKAIEVFGQKAGPDLADAIQGGRFAYEDFLSLLEESEGAVTNTYEQTQDGFDKIGLAIQGAKVDLGDFVGDLLSEHEPQITKAIEDITKKAKELIKWVTTNSGTVKNTLIGIGSVMTTVFAVTKIASFVSAVKTIAPAFVTLATKIGLLTVATDAAGASTLALNAAFLANPAVLVAAAIAGLAAGMIYLRKKSDEAMQAEYGLSEAEQQGISTANELAKAYEETAKSRDEAVKNVDAEYDYLEELVDEYNSLIDSNGRVKEGYAERADFIIGQLASAMGVEREQIEETITKNGKLGKSIDDLILKKKAEATLEAGKDAYTEAIQKRQDALNTYVQNLQTYNDAEQRYKESLKQSGDVLGEYNQKLKDSPATADKFYWANQEVIKSQETLKASMEEAQNGLKNAETAYVGYSSTISNWENLSQASASGAVNAIGEALRNIQNNFVTAETGTEQTLQNQLTAFQNNYANMKAAVEQGMPNVTDAQVAEAKKLVDAAQAELDKLSGETKKVGTKAGEELGKGVESKKGSAKTAGQNVGKAAVTGAEKASKNAKKTGKTTGDNYAKGVESAKSTAKKSGDKLAKDTKDAIEKTSKEATKTGQTTGQNYATGVESKTGAARSAGSSVGSNAADGMSGKAQTAYNYGADLGQGYVNGINSKVQAARQAAAQLASAAASQIPQTQKSKSPSKVTYKYGKDFTQGYIKGISSQQKTLVKTVKDVVSSVISELANMSNYNFTTVAKNASEAFANTMSNQTTYMLARMQYENEQKLKVYDTKITNLQNQQKKKQELQSKLDKAKNRKKTLEDKKNKTAADNKELKQQKKNIATYTKNLKAYNKNYEELIKKQNKFKEAYQTASSSMISDFTKAVQEYQTKAQQLIDETINGITDKYNARYDELIGKQNTLIEKLKSAGNLFEVSGAGVMTVNDIREQTKQIKDYTDKLTKIKNKVSSELFDEITTYDMKEGSAYLDRLLEMSAKDLADYNSAYTEKLRTAEKASESLYSADLKKVSTDYQNELDSAFKNVPSQLEALGKDAMVGFVDGLTKDTDYMSENIKTFIKAMTDEFKTQLKIKSPSKVMFGIGEYTGEGFNDGILSLLGAVKKTASQLAEAVSTPLDTMDTQITDIRGKVSQNALQGATGVSNSVVNNYNLVQNNNSPKSLSALETYQARRRQIDLVKAFA